MKKIIQNTVLLLLSIGIPLYAVEAFLAYIEWERELGTTQRIQMAAKREKVAWDDRDKTQVIADLQKEGKDAHPSMAPSVMLESNGFEIDGTRVFPFGGISNTVNVFCNEMGAWSIYTSDEHGFNNPKGVWNPGRVDALFVGDSFTQGACLKEGDDIAGQLRKTGFKTVNVGIGGTGPLIYQGVLREYGRFLRPKKVFWMFYGVDLRDSPAESASAILMKYHTDPNFSQRLFHRQKELDGLIREYYAEKYQQRLDELGEQRQARRGIITDRLIRHGLSLHKVTQRISNFGSPPLVTEGNEEVKLAFVRDTLVNAKREVASWGGELIFVYLPDWATWGAKYDSYGIRVDENFLLKPAVLDIVHELSVPMIDMQVKVFDPHPDPLSLFNFRTYGHYTLDGYKLVAGEVQRYLDADH